MQLPLSVASIVPVIWAAISSYGHNARRHWKTSGIAPVVHEVGPLNLSEFTDPVATNSFAVRIPSPFSLVTVNVIENVIDCCSSIIEDCNYRWNYF